MPFKIRLVFLDGTSFFLSLFRLLSEILKETTEDIEEIEYLTDGSWRPIKDEKERERERERSNTPEYPVVDICRCQTLGPLHYFLSHCQILLLYFLCV